MYLMGQSRRFLEAHGTKGASEVGARGVDVARGGQVARAPAVPAERLKVAFREDAFCRIDVLSTTYSTIIMMQHIIIRRGEVESIELTASVGTYTNTPAHIRDRGWIKSCAYCSYI